MQLIVEILKDIIKSKAGIIPAYIYDEAGIFEKYLCRLDENIDITNLSSGSKLALQVSLRNKQSSRYVVIYSKYNIDIGSMVATNKIQYVEINAEMIFSTFAGTKSRITGNIVLTPKQMELLVDNFESVIHDLESYEKITANILKVSLAKCVNGIYQTPKEIFVSLIKNEISMNRVRSLYLQEQINKIIEDSFGVIILDFSDNRNLFQKVLITLLIKNHKDFGASFNDYLLPVNEEKLIKVFDFIKANVDAFNQELFELNKFFVGKYTQTLTYYIPKLFENYIAENISDYCNLKINRELLWTNDMVILTDFVERISKMDMILNKYVSYSFSTNTISEIIKEYKESLSELDSLYRELSALYEVLSYSHDIYVKIDRANVYNKITEMYFNVLSNINSRYISGFNLIISDDDNAVRQDRILNNFEFERNTVFIFADGLRYEMAKPLKNDIICEDVVDYDVYSILPTETEIGMNGYFITDEKLRLNKKNIFELVMQAKVVVQVINWRIKKLAEILKQPVITFDEFKKMENYNGSVIYFYNDIDNALHNYNSSRKVTDSIQELKTVIQYSIDRKFDVMLLSDHGFIDIRNKIQLQDGDIDSEKKKSRYLILNSSEKADSMYYLDGIKVADFIEMANKKICFINSVNSLRQTTKYTHGGISLQETIITALLFRAKSIDQIQQAKFIVNVEAFNELKIETCGAKDAECFVYAGENKIFMCVVEDNDSIIRFPIRNYSKGDEFLIVINKGELVEKYAIKKSGITVIDKDLDIF
ncbi:PglZ domain-containing protein [Dehalobacterium formicoaceticum]|uniref:PglZ domain-containing protein n=1 Tax=Dehalobacterium formicoaceticum TaxID=51515 RepID=UPI000B7C606C|nr:PglZ domain-containing protein [Dehalobacterium formicoaceticum]